MPDAASGVRIIAYVSTHDGRAAVDHRAEDVLRQGAAGVHEPGRCSSFLDALPRTSTDKVDYQALTRLSLGGGR